MQTNLESDVAQLLNDIVAVQDDLFENLAKKRQMLIKSDVAGLNAMVPEEDQLVNRLRECVQRREQLLALAGQDGLPSNSIKALAEALPPERRGDLTDRVVQTNSRAKLLQHQSFTNWLVVQHTLIHLSQMIEIIATGGRLQPTYGNRETINTSGGLVDHAA